MALLEKQSYNFIRIGGCNSCHSQDLPSAAAAFARGRGLRAPREIPQLRRHVLKPLGGGCVAVEDLLDEMGFRLFRARFDGREMRIEVGVPEIERAASAEVRERILALARQIGVPLVTLDLEGFRSGKLNDPPRAAG